MKWNQIDCGFQVQTCFLGAGGGRNVLWTKCVLTPKQNLCIVVHFKDMCTAWKNEFEF